MALASDLEKGSYFKYNNILYKVIKREVIAVGTHSHSKLKFYVLDIINNTEKTLTLGHNDKVDILEAQQKVGQVVSKNDSSIQIMDTYSFETFDAEVNKNIADEINEGDKIIFLDLGNKKIVTNKAKG